MKKKALAILLTIAMVCALLPMAVSADKTTCPHTHVYCEMCYSSPCTNGVIAHHYVDGYCTYCGDSCPECDGDSCDLGEGNTCPVCGLEGTDHDYSDGSCDICGDTCLECGGDASAIAYGVTCPTCGLEGTYHENHVFEDGSCTMCDEVCPTCHGCQGFVYDAYDAGDFDANECPDCELDGGAHDFSEGSDCRNGSCDATCPHDNTCTWTSGICDTCGLPCDTCDGCGGNVTGTCDTCGLAEGPHDFSEGSNCCNGSCDATCPHNTYSNGECEECGSLCQWCYGCPGYIIDNGTCIGCGNTNVSGSHHFSYGSCICGEPCTGCGNDSSLAPCDGCGTCGKEGDLHNYSNGSCDGCGEDCPECYGDSCAIGAGNTCSTCLLDGTDHYYENSYCTYCGAACENCGGCKAKAYGYSGHKCSECGLPGVEDDHNWYDGYCSACDLDCPTCGEIDNDCELTDTCPTCGREPGDHWFDNGVCKDCGYICPHSFVCDECGENLCLHQELAAKPAEGETMTLTNGFTSLEIACESVKGGWRIRTAKGKKDDFNSAENKGKKGGFLSMADDGTLCFETSSKKATVWKWSNGIFFTEGSYQVTTPGFWFLFWYIPGSTRTMVVNYALNTLTEGAKLSTIGGAVRLYHTVLSEHRYGIAVNNFNGTHSHRCAVCGHVETVRCTYDEETNRCECGAINPNAHKFTVSVETDKTVVRGWFWISYTVFTAEISATGETSEVVKTEYSFDGERWRTGSTVTSNTELVHFWIRITDELGAKHVYEYKDGEVLGQNNITLTLGDNQYAELYWTYDDFENRENEIDSGSVEIPAGSVWIANEEAYDFPDVIFVCKAGTPEEIMESLIGYYDEENDTAVNDLFDTWGVCVIYNEEDYGFILEDGSGEEVLIKDAHQTGVFSADTTVTAIEDEYEYE